MLDGRRIYFVGIGGAGLSSYAFLARAWGAEVAGWDRRETPYLRTLEGIAVDIGDEPRPPAGWEVVVSSAHRDRAEGKSRAEFLAELVSLRDSIVVAGAHGKTTTTAMIAFVLRELGRDPAWLIGGEVPQLGGNAGSGDGWLVVEGDESDRTVEQLRPRVAVVTNIELDHHAEYASEAEVATLLEDWLDAAPRGGARLAARAGAGRACPARGAQPSERRDRPRRARARRGCGGDGGAGARRLPRGRQTLPARRPRSGA